VGKVRRAGVPSGKKPQHREKNPEVPGLRICKGVELEGREGAVGGRCFHGGSVDERAREAGTPREQLVPTWVSNLGGKEGHGFVGGIKPLERRRRAARLYGEAQERKG
jgi:hypothetical protein